MSTGTEFIDINTIKPYKYNNSSFLGKSINCHKFSYLIKNNGNYIIVNDDSKKYLPVVTISTNTDAGRTLNRDSFAILKFIEDNNDLFNKCVDSESLDEKTIILNKLIFKLAKESYKINNGISDSKDKYNKLKELICLNIGKLKGGAKNELNLEIYEYKLKNYPDSPNLFKNINPIITTRLIDSPDDICGIIKHNDDPEMSIRSCDPIHGDLKDIIDADTTLFPTTNEKYNFKLFDITSEDLIKFTNIYGAKVGTRVKVIPTDHGINTMSFFYDEDKIIELFQEIEALLLKD